MVSPAFVITENKKRTVIDENYRSFFVVDLKRIELSTSALRTRRSPS